MVRILGSRSALAVCVLALTLVAACGGQPLSATGNSDVATGGAQFSTADAATAALGADVGPGVFPRTVSHARGATVLRAKPARVVVLDTGELDDVLSLGVVPVGIASPDGKVPPYLEQRVQGVTRLGSTDPLNLEGAAALKPDLILGSKLRVDRLYDQLSMIAPTVLSIRPGFPWKENLRLVGAAMGAENRAVDLLNAYQRKATEARASFAGAPPTISLVRFRPGQLRLYGNLSFIGVILEDAGLPGPPAQDFDELAIEISEERIAEAAGDRIFYSSFGDPETTGKDAVVNGDLWARIPAVRAGHAAEVDDTVWFLGLGPTGANLVLDDLRRLLGPHG